MLAAAVPASDLDKSIAFYTKGLGMTLAGAPLYRFRYRGQPELQIGVMADEVRPLHPDAVITNPDGFDMVNYGLLAERAGGFSNG